MTEIMAAILGAIGLHFTLEFVKSIASTTNGVYTLAKNISSSTAVGASDIKLTIRDTDLAKKIRRIQIMLTEIKITEETSRTVIGCIEDIRDAIKDISDELVQINERMKYNDSIRIPLPYRSFRFHNNKKRLTSKMIVLESRHRALLEILPISGKLVRNDDQEEVIVLNAEQIKMNDARNVKQIRDNMQKSLEYIEE